MPVTLLLILFASAPSVFAYTINVNTGVKSGVCEELTINLCQDLGENLLSKLLMNRVK